MNDTPRPSSNVPQPLLYGLAVVGFIALVGGGIWLAVSSTQYVPGAVNAIGEAAVYLGSFFTPASTPPIISTATSTATTTSEEAGEASSTPPTTPSSKPTQPVAGNETSGAYPLDHATSTPPVLHGLPDFMVTIDAVGYLATTSANSFVASSTVPAGARPAVRFTIKNIGTNATGSWRFSASIPTSTGYLFQSVPQQSLNPGDRIDYTLGFDQALPGAGRTVTITANFDHAVTESDVSNDSASAQMTILGS